eukprot:GHRR01033541.1.p1 GENE.GHRR01033541.1~~GHRR01033541.1.p1  ORF type:complete len:142 (+),score=32.05 GHRR01033541.1:153-578(+)
MFRAYVHLCDDKEDRHLKGQRHPQVLLAHAHHTHIGTNNQAGIIRHVPSQAIRGGAEILLMTCTTKHDKQQLSSAINTHDCHHYKKAVSGHGPHMRRLSANDILFTGCANCIDNRSTKKQQLGCCSATLLCPSHREQHCMS